MKKSLLTLSLGGFGIGMTEFVMMGILPDIASQQKVTIPEAGHLISAYALGVVVGAPLLVSLAGKYPPKNILIGLMVLFTVFNGFSALAPNYEFLLTARFFSGLPHGAFFGVGAVVASRLAEKGKEAQAVSIMFSGLTFANIIGVPLGTYIGHNLSWRITFLIVAVIGVLTIISILLWLPSVVTSKSANRSDEFKLFGKLEPWMIIGITAIGTGGLFAWFSYIAPLLINVSHFESNSIMFVLMIAGVGMAVGNIIGGKLADRFSPLKTAICLLFAMMVSLGIVISVAEYQIPMLIMTFVTGAVAFSLVSPIQMLMITTAKDSEMLASSLTQASFNIGNALGAYFGGLPIAAGLGYVSPNWVGIVLAFIGFVIAIILLLKQKMNSVVEVREIVK